MMFKRHLFFFVLLLSQGFFYAQDRNALDKLDFVSDTDLPDINVSAIIQADKDKLKDQLEKWGGKLKYSYGDLSSVNIPLKK